MHAVRSLVSSGAILALLLTASPVQAAFIHTNDGETFTPRGFRRSISRNRDELQFQCDEEEVTGEKWACYRRHRRDRRKNPLNNSFFQREERLQQMGQRCGHLTNVGDWRACAKGERTGLRQMNETRDFGKRHTRRQAKELANECRKLETSDERLKCLQSRGNARTSKVKLNRRNIPIDNKPQDFISPYGLRRNLGRARDFLKKECGEIRDGQEKRACIKRVRNAYEGY